MKNNKYVFFSAAVFIVFCFMPVVTVLAAGDSSSGGYLSQYQNTPNPHPTGTSWLATFGYLLTLLVIFLFVVGLAYYVSHYLGGRFAKTSLKSENATLLSHFSLGPNRAVCIVEISSHVLILGVTDNNISLLKEITDVEEIENLRKNSSKILETDILGVFGQQFNSLDKISKRLPGLFKNKYHK